MAKITVRVVVVVNRHFEMLRLKSTHSNQQIWFTNFLLKERLTEFAKMCRLQSLIINL